MPLHRKRKSKIVAPATIYFTQGKNDDGDKQPCVYAECAYGGNRAGPIWGHSWASVTRCLAALSKKCDCGRVRHKQRYTEGCPARKCA
jgi:hypothetical protein